MATAKATLNTAARIYGISSEGANLMAYRVARASVDLQAGLGAGIGYLNNRGANITIGIPLFDYSATVTQFALQAYEFSY